MCQTVNAWTVASKLLGIRIVVPFTLSNENEFVECIAFLPDFGSPRGMVLGLTTPPEFKTDAVLIKCAKKRKLFYSFINPAIYSTYDEKRFKEVLTDWGFFGPIEKRPAWLT